MRAAALQGFATATDLADYLVKRGLPFRDAHEAVAHAVRECELRAMIWRSDHTGTSEIQLAIDDDVHAVLDIEGSVAARSHIGGGWRTRARARSSATGDFRTARLGKPRLIPRACRYGKTC